MYVKPTLLNNLRITNNTILDAQTRISTGKKVNSAIDDPLAFNRITITKASVSNAAVKLNTLEYGMSRLDARDSTLNSFQDAAQRFQELTTMASSGIHNLNDLRPEMQSLYDSMVSLANTKDASGMMFAGTANNVVPFTKDPATGVVTYNGTPDDNVIDIEGVQVRGSISGEPLMEAFDAMKAILDSVVGGTNPTSAQLTAVADSVETVLGLRTEGAAQSAAANIIKNSLTSRSDRETADIDRLESADPTDEAIRMTEAQKQYESILKITGTELSRRRLLDFL